MSDALSKIVQKKPRKIKTSAEKPKKEASASQLTKQIQEIQRLLLVWPSAPSRVVEQFVRDTFGVSMTRRCLQEAKEALGLHKPDYSETTIHKKALAEYIICDLVRTYGVGGLAEDTYCSRVTKALNEKFSEKTHSRLIREWVRNQLKILLPSAVSKEDLEEAYRVAKDRIIALGLLKEATGQTSLL